MLCSCVCVLLLLLLRENEGVKVVNYKVPIAGAALPSTYFEVDTMNSRLIVGATNLVFNLDFELTTVSNLVQSVDSDKLAVCGANGLDPKKCHNLYHLVKKTSGSGLITADDGNTTYEYDDLVLMCSSHAYHPECVYRTTSDLKQVKSFRATGYIPSEANPPLPSLLLEGNALMTAPDLNSFDRSNHVLVPKSTAPFNTTSARVGGRIDTNWFIEPNFVSMNEIGDYIYIFFREKAREQDSNVYYSRAARVCKNDEGALHVDSLNVFTTFEKARITCDSGSPETYFYDEIQDTYYSQEEGLLYALFNTARYGPAGSALCVYSINKTKNDLFRVFDGKFFDQSGSGVPLPTNVRGNFGCERSLEDALDYQLIMNRTRPVSTTPLIKQDGYSFHRMAPPVAVNGYDVLFVTASKVSESGSDLYLMKYVKRYSDTTYTLIQNTTLPSDLDQAYITRMVLHGTGKDARIIIGTFDSIYSVPVQSCDDYTTCQSCMESNDPYCSYDSSQEACVAMEGSSSATVAQQMQTDPLLCAVIHEHDNTTDKPPIDSPVKTDSTEHDDSVSGVGLAPQEMLRSSNVWIIVGSVCGFVGGLAIGVVVSALFRRCMFRRGKYSCASAASSCELANGSRNNSDVTIAPLKLHSVIVNQTDSQQHLKSNGKDFTCSSENDYSHPPDKSDSETCKKIPPSTPLKSYPSISPTKSSESDDSGIIGASKCDIGTPSPKVFTVPVQTKPNLPQSSGYRQQGAIFKFDPTSIKMNSSPSGEASGVPSARRCTEPNMASGSSTAPLRGTDPNLKSNYRQNVHITNQQRQNYGRNILARHPSIDGSKSKYIPSANSDGSARPPPERRPPPPVRPKPSTQTSTKTVVRLDDGDVGSSQC